MRKKMIEIKDEYIRLRNQQQEHLNKAMHEADLSLARKMQQDAMTTYTERLGHLAKTLRAVGIDPAAI